uniref:HPP transmembrane region domain-containing protein n=1 Tax=Aegilops tauschii subsp. strangulata TaxID=200361 RepID=A0A453H3E9_AEGTS
MCLTVKREIWITNTNTLRWKFLQKYNMFVAQIGCAAIGVLALSLFGPGWLARGAALSASIAFMTITGSSHPPAASLPLLFIDGPKFHHLQLWYALFPGAAGCAILCLIVS